MPPPAHIVEPAVAAYLGRAVLVEIEVPKGARIKRVNGQIDLVSPLPSPFNYGALPHTEAPDGDRLDALWLGPPVGRGLRVHTTARAVVAFTDAGQPDPKLVCADHPLTHADRALVQGFFQRYARLKGWLNRLRGRGGPTRVDGWLEAP